jgi:hypothetical protein
MVKIIGTALLIYGVAGVVGTFLVYGTLRGPIQKLRELLKDVSGKLDQGGDHAKKASDWINKGSPILQKVADLLAKIVAFIRQVAQRIGEVVGLINSIESTLDSIKVPVLTFQTRTLSLSFGTEVVTGVRLKEYNVVGVKVYGPPITLDTTFVGLNLGQVSVVSGFNLEHVFPLRPVGDVFHSIGEKVEDVQKQVDHTGDRFEETKARTLEAKESVENTAERMKDFAGKLEETSQNVKEMSESKLLSLIPGLVLGYFGLIHLAFALTGLALLFS